MLELGGAWIWARLFRRTVEKPVDTKSANNFFCFIGCFDPEMQQ
jgi:hypothetical protein